MKNYYLSLFNRRHEHEMSININQEELDKFNETFKNDPAKFAKVEDLEARTTMFFRKSKSKQKWVEVSAPKCELR